MKKYFFNFQAVQASLIFALLYCILFSWYLIRTPWILVWIVRIKQFTVTKQSNITMRYYKQSKCLKSSLKQRYTQHRLILIDMKMNIIYVQNSPNNHCTNSIKSEMQPNNLAMCVRIGFLQIDHMKSEERTKRSNCQRYQRSMQRKIFRRYWHWGRRSGSGVVFSHCLQSMRPPIFRPPGWKNCYPV